MRTLFDSDEENYYEPLRIGNTLSSNFSEYESNGDKGKTLSIEEYFDKIRPHLSNMINDPKIQGERKIQLTIAINFCSCKDTGEMRTMHCKGGNIKIIIKSLQNFLILF